MKWTICYLGFFTLNFQPTRLRARSNSTLSIRGLIARNSVARCEVFVSVSSFELKVYSLDRYIASHSLSWG